VLVASYAVTALYLHSTGVPLAIPIGVYYNFLFYIVLLVYKEPLYFILMVLYIVSKRF